MKNECLKDTRIKEYIAKQSGVRDEEDPFITCYILPVKMELSKETTLHSCFTCCNKTSSMTIF